MKLVIRIISIITLFIPIVIPFLVLGFILQCCITGFEDGRSLFNSLDKYLSR